MPPFVEQGIDDAIAGHYSKHKLSPILGSDEFINRTLKNSSNQDKAKINKSLGQTPAIEESLLQSPKH